MNEFDGARNDAAHSLTVFPVSANINYLSGTALSQFENYGEFLIENPGNATKLVLWLESGEFRVRPGDYLGVNYLDADLDDANDAITITGHEYTSGDGPFRLTNFSPAMTLETSVVIGASSPGTFTRTVGSWLDEGYTGGKDITLANSASNDGPFTLDTVTDLVMTCIPSNTVIAELAQTDLTFTIGSVSLHPGLDEVTDYYVRSEDANSITFHLTKAAAQNSSSTPVEIRDPQMTPGTSIVIAAGSNTDLIRTVGSWLDEGFLNGDIIYIQNHVTNKTFAGITNISDLVMELATVLTPEAAQTDLIIQNAFHAGVHSIGSAQGEGLITSPPSGETTSGYGSLSLDSTNRQYIVTPAPAALTILPVDETAALAYWWVP
jgi:hypothetical protein